MQHTDLFLTLDLICISWLWARRFLALFLVGAHWSLYHTTRYRFQTLSRLYFRTGFYLLPLGVRVPTLVQRFMPSVMRASQLGTSRVRARRSVHIHCIVHLGGQISHFATFAQSANIVTDSVNSKTHVCRWQWCGSVVGKHPVLGQLQVLVGHGDTGVLLIV